MSQESKLSPTANAVKQALSFLPSLYEQVTTLLNPNDVESVRKLSKIEIEHGFAKILQEAREHAPVDQEAISRRIGIPTYNIYELSIREGSEQFLGAGHAVLEELREEFGEAIASHMMCEFSTIAFWEIIEYVLQQVDSEATLQWYRVIPKPPRMFKLSTNSLNDPPHSVFFTVIKKEEYIIDLSRGQYGIPVSDWFVPVEEYLNKWVVKKDSEYVGCTHLAPTEDVKFLKEQLCDDFKTISAAIGIAFMAWREMSADGGEKEIEKLRKDVVEGVKEAKKEIVKRNTEAAERDKSSVAQMMGAKIWI